MVYDIVYFLSASVQALELVFCCLMFCRLLSQGPTEWLGRCKIVAICLLFTCDVCYLARTCQVVAVELVYLYLETKNG